MKILLINNCHFRRGGADIVYLQTGQMLKDNGNDVFYFSQNSSLNIYSSFSKYFIKEKIYIGKPILDSILLTPRFFFSFEAQNKISLLINDFRPEIAHIHLYKAILTPAILTTLKKYHIPVVISLHDYGLLCPHNLMLDGEGDICTRCVTGSPLNCILHRCNRKNLILSSLNALEFVFHSTFIPVEKYVKKIVAVSKFGQNLLNNSGKFRQKVEHLYNFYPNLDLTIPNSKKGNYFLFYGRLSAEKGALNLFNAWISKNRNSILKVVGIGELQIELDKYASQHKNIEVLGFKSGDELLTIINEALFIIVPSEWYENNPLTIIEAYANGKPVIGANVGGIPEIIEDNKTGYLFKMKDIDDLSSKIELAENISNEQYEIMSKNARAFAEKHFSPQNHYEKLMKIYNETIKENYNRIS